MGNPQSKSGGGGGQATVSTPVTASDSPRNEMSSRQGSSEFGDWIQAGASFVVRQEYQPLELNTHIILPLRTVFELKTQEREATRSPFHLCVVLDTSGSMAGSKLANLKTAVESLLSLLIDEDVISIITYETRAELLAYRKTKADVQVVLCDLHRVDANGGTNISGALELAKSALEGTVPGRPLSSIVAAITSSTIATAPKRIFLYTDGQPGCGLTTTEDLSALCKTMFDQNSIVTSTFGIGEDVNGELLESMAEQGGGGYEFVTPRRIDELTRKALHGLAKVVASRGEITIDFMYSGVRIVHPERVDNVPATLSTSSSADHGYTITIGDVRQGNVHRLPFAVELTPDVQRAILATLSSTSSSTSADGQDGVEDQVVVPFAKISFSCQPIDNPLHRLELTHSLDLSISLPRSSEAPAASRAPHRAPDPVVLVSFTLLDMADRNDRALEMLQEGTAEAVASAVTLLSGGIEEMRRVQPFDTEGFVETAIRRAERTLQRLQVRGVRDAQRIALELQMQNHVFDRQSGAGFAMSEDGNHSQVFIPGDSPPRSPRPGYPPYLSGGGGGHSPYLDSAIHTPTSDMDAADLMDRFPTMETFTSPTRDSHGRRSSDATASTLRPIELSPALKEAIAAIEAGTLSQKDSKIPAEFYCPITQAVMDDPVMTSDGHTYQRPAIEQWFTDGNLTSPLTGLGLPDLEVRPNIVLRSMISGWHP